MQAGLILIIPLDGSVQCDCQQATNTTKLIDNVYCASVSITLLYNMPYIQI